VRQYVVQRCYGLGRTHRPGQPQRHRSFLTAFHFKWQAASYELAACAYGHTRQNRTSDSQRQHPNAERLVLTLHF
jgi:hypothetical protein